MSKGPTISVSALTPGKASTARYRVARGPRPVSWEPLLHTRVYTVAGVRARTRIAGGAFDAFSAFYPDEHWARMLCRCNIKLVRIL